MPGRRIGYLAVLLGLMLYYFASGEWISWLLLMWVMVLPWLSLGLSIPAIRRFAVCPTGAKRVQMGQRAELWLLGSCDLPMPPFRGGIRLREEFRGKPQRYQPEKGVPTDHCGAWTAAVDGVRVCDYLGLFSFRPASTREETLYIRPLPVSAPGFLPPGPDQAEAWRPRYGGGMAENHELRPYRPGDSLNAVHWKLTIKTGALLVREPMEPVRGRLLLTMTLSGTPEELDRKLGRLVWAGEFLLEREPELTVRVLCGSGILEFTLHSREELMQAVDTLLTSPPAPSGSIRSRTYRAFWQYHIGGQPDEA